MCGICGKVAFDGRVIDAGLIERMLATLIHRGPDDQGVYTAPFIGLGQRRLSIIDLSRVATAPLSNEDGTIWVTHNGEIYNFQTLREELIQKGHEFRTRGDTEVLVHLYEEHGPDLVARLRGMFAFAIWDSRRGLLFAARDRFGKKPFFYARTPTGLVFGSEIKAITADPDVPVAPDFRAIDRYLTLQYVPSPWSAFEGIRRLPPAHTLTCMANGRVEVRRYWQLRADHKLTSPPDQIAEELLQRLREAVRLRLMADVPLGAFLSGGVDSSAVVALMAEASGGPVKTFSIGFDDDAFNELPYAREVALRYGTDHHEFVVRPEIADLLPRLVRLYNEPFADSSAVPTYYVAKITREHVKVALSGDGGDESFSGYENYARVNRWSAADVIPAVARRRVFGSAAALLDRLPYNNPLARASRGLNMIALDLRGRLALQTSIFKPREKRALYTRHFRAMVNGDDSAGWEGADLTWNQAADSLDWMMQYDLRSYLPDCLMTKTDIASMANSLEVRCPFLDHPLVEFAAAIPSALKRNEQRGKVILRRALRNLVPPTVLERPKMGFAVPLGKWLRTELADMLSAVLLDGRAQRRDLFVPTFVRRMIREQSQGVRDWSSRLWALLWLELWFREYID